MHLKAAVALVCAAVPLFGAAQPALAQSQQVLIIAHRGASAQRPEHTLAAYDLAITQGADFIEPDLVVTRDGILVARHENEISGTTDVADHPEFASRLTTRMVDGGEVTGWFTEDFTLAELRTLRARERLPEIRPANMAFDGLYQVPTLAEIIRLVRAREAETGRSIGIYPELKHPTYYAGNGFDLVELLVEQLASAGYDSADDAVFIQSFDVAPLIRLNTLTEARLVQLVEADGSTADNPALAYADMITPAGLAQIATYADVLAADIRLILEADGSPTALVENAHRAGLLVHAWTVREEAVFLPEALRSPEPGFGAQVLRQLLRDAGVDGIFDDAARAPGPVRTLAP